MTSDGGTRTAQTGIEIRRLTVADAEPYRRIRLASLASDPDAFGATYEERARQPLAAFADRLATATVLAACAAADFVGVAHLTAGSGAKEAHKGMIQGFFVEPGWRRRGIAAALMTAVIETARGNLEQLHLTVVQDNVAAIRLYQQFGFRSYGLEPRALKTAKGYSDEHLMVLML